MVDKKLTELDAITPTVDDLVYVVDDPLVTPVSKKSTVANLLSTVNSTATAAYASRAAASKAGNLFLPNDGLVIERDTGAAYAPWGPVFTLTKPVLNDFAWVNQGAASGTEERGGITMIGPAGAALNHRILKKAAPATPYTITALFIPGIIPVDYQAYGLYLRESATSKLVIWRILYNGGNKWNISYYTDETTFSSDLLTIVGYHHNPMWLQINADGTNLKFLVSGNGYDFTQMCTTLKNAFFTTAPNEVGWGAQAQNATYGTITSLISWKET